MNFKKEVCLSFQMIEAVASVLEIASIFLCIFVCATETDCSILAAEDVVYIQRLEL